MTMTEKYKILGKYIKDMSSETPDIQTYMFVKENISKYQLNIEISSKPIKNRMIEVKNIGIKKIIAIDEIRSEVSALKLLTARKIKACPVIKNSRRNLFEI